MKPLTPPEQAVYELVLLGLPDKAIAARIGRAVGTVKCHVRSILDKRGAGRRIDLILSQRAAGSQGYGAQPKE